MTRTAPKDFQTLIPAGFLNVRPTILSYWGNQPGTPILPGNLLPSLYRSIENFARKCQYVRSTFKCSYPKHNTVGFLRFDSLELSDPQHGANNATADPSNITEIPIFNATNSSTEAYDASGSHRPKVSVKHRFQGGPVPYGNYFEGPAALTLNVAFHDKATKVATDSSRTVNGVTTSIWLGPQRTKLPALLTYRDVLDMVLWAGRKAVDEFQEFKPSNFREVVVSAYYQTGATKDLWLGDLELKRADGSGERLLNASTPAADVATNAPGQVETS
ncbi:uncharacterized protein KY384_001306 [Bacidia gigantensis]|uniref:uncharacterized protein n=1 Tax=Bacidia gigantensis TaxID=2732470 RepID=UPI001D0581C1|nr:uncharacterized protein KY384_001306 [Bacidia gigantensis]KAG8533566.1 hypothetical protein KY384_001306 [Bacidia gigantensis]